MGVAEIKRAAINTAVVLACIWVLRRVPATRAVVDQALVG